jgi:hypothetical protein
VLHCATGILSHIILNNNFCLRSQYSQCENNLDFKKRQKFFKEKLPKLLKKSVNKSLFSLEILRKLIKSKKTVYSIVNRI